MPDFVAYATRSTDDILTDNLVETINQRISPDNIEIQKPVVLKKKDSVLIIFDPIPDLEFTSDYLRIGNILEYCTPPDGCFTQVTLEEDGISLQTNTLGSNTIWYYFDENKFIASSSQRAIISILGNFIINMDAVYSFLYTGCLGFGLSWDKSLRVCSRNEKLSLQTETWSLHRESLKKLPSFSAINVPEKEQKDELMSCLDEVFDRFDIPFQRTVLTLSGGFDSRFILLQLVKRGIFPKTITWGHPDSLRDEKSDACVAQELAKTFQLDHSFLPACAQVEPIEITFDRFIRLGEGRVDNIHAYMDGFSLWKKLRESGVSGAIRGDEVFGWQPATSVIEVLKPFNLLFGTDYANSNIVNNLFNNHNFNIKWNDLEQAKGESLATWRDRLYQEYRVPYFLSSLNYLKTKYVNIYTPLLSRIVIEKVRKTSDRLRTDKLLFKKMVNSEFSSVPLASRSATVSFGWILSQKECLLVINKKLNSCKDNGLFSKEGVDQLLVQLNNKPEVKINRFSLKLIVPAWFRNLIKKIGFYKPKTYIDPKVLSFRIYIIYCINELFIEDSCSGMVAKK